MLKALISLFLLRGTSIFDVENSVECVWISCGVINAFNIINIVHNKGM